MKKSLCGLFLLTLLCFTVNSPASKRDADSTYVNTPRLSADFQGNIDSLLGVWYNQNSQIEESIFSDSTFNDSTAVHYSNIPDSVYISRLKRLPYEIPLTYNKITRNFIELYIFRKRDKLQTIIGLSDYYFPILDNIIDKYDIPKELRNISIIESALNPRATSRARAAGLWQFIYGTGRLYGLTMNSLVDERRDPIKATNAACRYFKDLYAIFGDWHLVIAAYNCGPNNVKKAIRRSGGKRDFWEIYRFLPRETRGYVPAFIGASYAINYYREHNITPTPLSLPMYTDTLMISHDVHLGQISQKLGISVEQLRDLNPQYIRDIVPARGGLMYPIRLPIDYVSKYIDNENSIYHYNDSLFFTIDYLKNPNYYSSLIGAPGKNYSKITYIVKQGDYVASVAKHFGCSSTEVKDWNNLYRNRLKVGKKLVIYVPKKKAAKFKAELNGEKTNVEEDNTVNAGDYIMYTVKSGDSLWSISQMYPGSSDEQIRQINNIGSSETIKPGQHLKIMKKASANN